MQMPSMIPLLHAHIGLNVVPNLLLKSEGMQAARLVEHGYVRRYMRSMQIADVVNSMHDLMQMSQHEPSPMLALRQFHMAVANGQQQSPESMQSMPTVTGTQARVSALLLHRPLCRCIDCCAGALGLKCTKSFHSLHM